MGPDSVRVLVVDDELFFREAIRDVLTGAGLGCVLAATGEEGLELAEEPGVRVAILDVGLPGIDGIEVLRQLRAQRPDLRVVILSAHNDQERVLEALRLGACDYLAKPLHDEELVLAVRRALAVFELARTAERLREGLGSLESRMAALARVAGTLDGGEGAEILRARAAEAVADLLAADKTSLLLLDDADSELRVAAATGRKLAVPEFDPVPLGEGIAGHAFVCGEALLVADVSADEEFRDLAAEDGRYASGSFAIALLQAGDRRLGLLCAADPVQRDSFGEDDLALLRILALQIAPLLERRSASETPPARLAEVSGEGQTAPFLAGLPGSDPDAELARAVCDAVAAEIEPERIFDAALRPVARMLEATCAAVFLRDAATGELVREAQIEGEGPGDRERLPSDRGLTGMVFGTGRPVATDDPSADRRFELDVDTPVAEEPGPLLCLPLVFRGRTLGVFRAFLAQRGRTSPRTGEILAAALSAAVRSVLLYRSLVETIDEVARARRQFPDRGRAR